MKIKGSPGIAWLLLTISLAIHVMDEAKNDFLPIYNALARIVGSLPVFSFDNWVILIIIMLSILSILTFFAFKASKLICYLSFVYGVLTIIHGMGHVAISFYFKEPSVGFYSSFLLFIAGTYLILKAWKTLKSLRLQQSSTIIS